MISSSSRWLRDVSWLLERPISTLGGIEVDTLASIVRSRQNLSRVPRCTDRRHTSHIFSSFESSVGFSGEPSVVVAAGARGSL